jgi:heme/copper-type cytochrome/quinol oxidase subunit 2
MLFTLKVVTPAQFHQWIAGQQAAAKPPSSGQTAAKTVSGSGVK